MCGEVVWQLRGWLVVRAAWRSVLVVALVKVLRLFLADLINCLFQ